MRTLPPRQEIPFPPPRITLEPLEEEPVVPLTPRTPVNSHTARAPVDDDARVRTRTRGRVKIVFRDESQDVEEDDEVVLGKNRVSIY